MRLYPAIDLKDGACVRLRRGEMDQATVYSTDPGAQARAWQDAGADYLHVVDLNGAFAGRPVNAAAVAAILAAATVPVQLGGGIRDMAGVARWIEAGVARVILGSAALKTPELVHEACRAFPGQVAVGIDARNGMVAAEGWAETSSVSAAELGLRFEDAGVSAIIYTDIARDGMLEGLNLEATAALAATGSGPRSSPAAAWARSTISGRCATRPMPRRRGPSRASSSAARCMTAGSILRPRWRCCTDPPPPDKSGIHLDKVQPCRTCTCNHLQSIVYLFTGD